MVQSVSAAVQQLVHLCDYSMANGKWENKFVFNYSQFSLSYCSCTSTMVSFFTSDDNFLSVLQLIYTPRQT